MSVAKNKNRIIKNSYRKILVFLTLNLKTKEIQRGSIIVFTVLMLAAILTITLTLTRIFIPRIRALGEATDSVTAIFAADSAMEWCLYNNREKTPSLPQPTLSNGATYQIYSDGSPSACPGGESANYRTVGSYRGVSRSFEVSGAPE